MRPLLKNPNLGILETRVGDLLVPLLDFLEIESKYK